MRVMVAMLLIGCAGAPPPAPVEIPKFVERPVERARVNGIEIAWDAFGDPAKPAVLLVMGLGMQMIGWDEEFCQKLAARGFRVIRFDNRDVGLSTWFDQAGDPNPLQVADELRRKRPVKSAYLLSDMADDAFGLLDSLGIKEAHMVGVSMGGMIAQQMAIARPERVRTLTSIMSTTGDPNVKGASFEVLTALLEPFPAERNGFIERSVRLARTIGATRDVRRTAARSFDRAYHPAGIKRQLIAVWLSGSRKQALAKLAIPTLVIHGDADPLIPPDGGRDTAAAIPGAKLEIIAGMGHDLPREVWPRVIDAIAAQAARGK